MLPIIKLSQCNSVMPQMQVVNCFNDTEGPPWKHSLFGNPNDADTIKYSEQLISMFISVDIKLHFKKSTLIYADEDQKWLRLLQKGTLTWLSVLLLTFSFLVCSKLL